MDSCPHVKAREAGSIVSVAVKVAVAVNTEGQRQVIGMKVGPSEAETFWMVISDAHLGLKAAAAKVREATRQRCRVHFMRNALAHANKTQRRMVSATIATVCAQVCDRYAKGPVLARVAIHPMPVDTDLQRAVLISSPTSARVQPGLGPSVAVGVAHGGVGGGRRT